MDTTLLSIALAASMILMLALGVWVSLTLVGIGVLGLLLSGNDQIGLLFATSSWGASTGWSLTALPMFIWMGEVLFRTRLSEDLFKGLSPWMGGLPGKLLHVNILSCGIFAAVSGSSAATAATIGRMTLPELKALARPEPATPLPRFLFPPRLQRGAGSSRGKNVQPIP